MKKSSLIGIDTWYFLALSIYSGLTLIMNLSFSKGNIAIKPYHDGMFNASTAPKFQIYYLALIGMIQQLDLKTKPLLDLMYRGSHGVEH